MSTAAPLVTATPTLDAGEIERRPDSPREVYNSPSSISDVDCSVEKVARDSEVRCRIRVLSLYLM